MMGPRTKLTPKIYSGQQTLKGRCPVGHGGNFRLSPSFTVTVRPLIRLNVRLSVVPSVHPSVRPPPQRDSEGLRELQIASEEPQGPTGVFRGPQGTLGGLGRLREHQRASSSRRRPGKASEDLKEACRASQGKPNGQTDIGRTDMEITLCVLQDIVPFGFASRAN